jgi:hypothetical protein
MIFCFMCLAADVTKTTKAMDDRVKKLEEAHKKENASIEVFGVH